MGIRSIIWKNKLESYIKELYLGQRKNYREIAEIIKRDKEINISREAVRNFLNNEISTR